VLARFAQPERNSDGRRPLMPLGPVARKWEGHMRSIFVSLAATIAAVVMAASPAAAS
jgi:hypothetical protein